MTQGYDPYHLASPAVYLVKIIIFLVLVGLVAAILFTNIITFFWANPFINSMIFFALAIGIFLSCRQIFRLFPEVTGACAAALHLLCCGSQGGPEGGTEALDAAPAGGRTQALGAVDAPLRLATPRLPAPVRDLPV